jgi:hypothetical protein
MGEMLICYTIMRIRVWNKLGEAKYNCTYVSRLIREHLIISKGVTIFILILSGTGGVMGWDLWKKYPSVVCIIIAVVSLLKLVSDELIPSEKSISSLHEIQDFYANQFKQLDKLRFDVDHKEGINEQEIFDRLNEICEKEKDINRKVNSTILYNPPRLVKKSKTLTDIYFNQNFNHG